MGVKKGAADLGYLGEVTKSVMVTGSPPAQDLAALAALKEKLVQNMVNLARKVEADAGAILSDAQGEVVLGIQEKALKGDTEITVKELTAAGAAGAVPAAPAGYRQVSPLYDFGPDGVTFEIPATLILKVVLSPLIKPENLALAWYDRAHGRWVAVPAVVDATQGLVLAKLRHFTAYAVFARLPQKSFTDVTPASSGWAREAVERLAGAGIVAGADGRRFAPTRAMTRAEFATLLVRALGLEERDCTVCPFRDVDAGSWYAGTVTAAAYAGLVKGFPDGSFRPNAPVNREEVAVLIARAAGAGTARTDLPFADAVGIHSWAKADVAAAVAGGLVKGFPDGTFRPAAPASRAAGAVMVYRMLAGLNF
uniref:S-layer homology domain-containing protein n=1 Tax=Ammonifex degensii TaxID=42838 RepID=A0A7C2EJG5_9THEO